MSRYATGVTARSRCGLAIGLLLITIVMTSQAWAEDGFTPIEVKSGDKTFKTLARLTGFRLTSKVVASLEENGAIIKRDGDGKVVSIHANGVIAKANPNGMFSSVPKITDEMFVLLEFLDKVKTEQLRKEIEDLLRSQGTFEAATFRKKLDTGFKNKDAEELREKYVQMKKPRTAPPILFKDFTKASKSQIISRNNRHNLNKKREAKLADLKNDDAASAARSLIRSYERFVKDDKPPAAIKIDEFKRTIASDFGDLPRSDKHEPLVLYTYAVINAQLNERPIASVQLKTLVRDYPHYWDARRAYVYAVTVEKSYLQGSRELKKLFDELMRTIQDGNPTPEELKVLLVEHSWVVDMAAVFEVKPRTKDEADEILKDPRSKEMIAAAQMRLLGVLADEAQRNKEKAAEEAKRIAMLVEKAKGTFKVGKEAYTQQWNQRYALFLQANNAYQLSNGFWRMAQAQVFQDQANLNRISGRLESARRRLDDAEGDERDRIDDEVERLMDEETRARGQLNFALGREAMTRVIAQRDFQQRQFQINFLQGIMGNARIFLFDFTNEFYEAIANDADLQANYRVLENTVYDSRRQLFALALQEQAKLKPSNLLKKESKEVAGLLRFSPHQTLVELKKELLPGAGN